MPTTVDNQKRSSRSSAAESRARIVAAARLALARAGYDTVDFERSRRRRAAIPPLCCACSARSRRFSPKSLKLPSALNRLSKDRSRGSAAGLRITCSDRSRKPIPELSTNFSSSCDPSEVRSRRRSSPKLCMRALSSRSPNACAGGGRPSEGGADYGLCSRFCGPASARRRST
jgi:hypothetical protein